MAEDNTPSTSDSESEEPIIPEPKTEPEAPPRPDVFFAFGPEHRYFVMCGSKWKIKYPKWVVWDDLKVPNPEWVAFKHTGNGFFVGGATAAGVPSFSHSWKSDFMVKDQDVDDYVKARDAYRGLYQWLSDMNQEHPDGIRYANIVFGPDASYFASVGNSSTSNNLPPDLVEAIAKSKKEANRSPAIVALGVDSTWAVIWTDGTLNWDLKDKYVDLVGSGVLRRGYPPPVYMALNPFQGNQFFVLTSDGSINYKTTFETADDSKQLDEMTMKYMLKRVEENGTILSHRYNQDGVQKHFTITPEAARAMRRRAEITSASGRYLDLWWERRHLLMKQQQLQRMAIIGGVTAGFAKIAGASTPRALVMGAGACIGMAAAEISRAEP